MKKGDCDLLLAQVLADSTKDLPNDEAKDKFTAETFLPAAQTVGNQCQEQKTKKMVRDDRQCSLDSYKDEKKPKVKILTTRGGSILEMPFIPYLKAAAAGRVSGISGASIAGPTSTIVMLTRPVPTAKFSEFIKGLKDGGMTKLAYEAMRLFNDAVEREDFDPSKIDALVDSIMGAVQPYTEIVSAVEDEADKKSAINDAHDALSKTIIYKFDADGKGDFRTLPEEVWGAGKNLVEKTALRKLFTNAIPHYLKNDKAPAYATADVTKALGELGAAMLSAIQKSAEKDPAKLVVKEVKTDGSGKPTEVIFMDGAEAAKALAASGLEDTDGRALPKRLIQGLGAGWNEIALEPLKELWRAAYLKNAKLAKIGTPERERAIDSMIEQLEGASPVGIKSAVVEDVKRDGTVVLGNLPEKKFADRYLNYLSTLEGDMYMAFYDKITELHREAVNSADFKAKKFTEDDVASAIERSLRDAISGGKPKGLSTFGLLHYAGLDKNKKPSFAAKTDDKGRFGGEASVVTYFDSGRAILQGRLSADVRAWDINPNWSLSVHGGVAYGERPGYFTRELNRPTSNPQGVKDNSLVTGINLSVDGKVMVGKEGEKRPLGMSIVAGIVEDGNDFRNRIVFPSYTLSIPFGKKDETGSGSVSLGASIGKYLDINTNSNTQDQWNLNESFFLGGSAGVKWLMNKAWKANLGLSLQYDHTLNGSAAKLLQGLFELSAQLPGTGLAGAFKMIYSGSYSENNWHYLSFRIPIEFMFPLPEGWEIGPQVIYRTDLFSTGFDKTNDSNYTLDSAANGGTIPSSIVTDPSNGKFIHILNPQLCIKHDGTVVGARVCMGYACAMQNPYINHFGTFNGALTW
ncbi:MAG: hypothetical protein BWY40_01410 [bacterium ADurb.Bin270]|nr:MAG: hypothetical protein BWY40_01410 [bacterium ADurb.Bin270]